jgi:hypothetical protein
MVQPEFQLVVEFENSEQRIFNMLPYIDQKPWAKLKESNTFQGAFIENGTVAWPGNIDIDPETLYEFSAPLNTTASKYAKLANSASTAAVTDN